ncbi:hypothetical protein Clacol_006986 [Clathrus columnatus]|nr:hypothetical protein Clacol_006986 [Clathrus columnatus]
MSEWFKPISRTLEAVAGTVRFQQDTMAALVRFYKGKCVQQRAMLQKAREMAPEIKALQAQIEQLQQENLQLRQATANRNTIPGAHFDNRNRSFSDSTSYEVSDFRNNNGKRPMVPVRGFPQHRSSSPKTIITPIPPSRITLPPDHQPPESRNERPTDGNGNRDSLNVSNSPRFGQFAYQPPQTPSRSPSGRQQQFHFRPQSSMMMVPENGPNNVAQYDRRRHQQQRSMPPPPTPVQRRPSMQTDNNIAPRTTRGTFRPASTVLPHSEWEPPQRFSMNVNVDPTPNAAPSAPVMPVTPSTNRFFAPRPHTIAPDAVRNINANLVSGNRIPFVPRQLLYVSKVANIRYDLDKYIDCLKEALLASVILGER